MAQYDPKVIQAFADDLYRRASSIVVLNVLFFGAIGAIGGFFMFRGSGAAILGAIGVALGYYLGSQRAFLLKLQAQTALCQVEIERNTRSSNTAAESPGLLISIEPLPMSTRAAEEALDTKRGKCPNCTRVIPLTAIECPRCRVVLGAASSWKVQPL